MNELNCAIDLIIIGTNQLRTDYTDKLTKFMLRGIAKNLPWINQIFLVLPNLESIPAGLNLSEFKILFYEDIVPQDILDKVSKHNIELFVPNIVELSENYLIMRDTTFILEPLQVDQFFDFNNNKLKISTTPCLTKENFPRNIKINKSFLYNNSDMNLPAILERPNFGLVSGKKSLWLQFINENFMNIQKNFDEYSQEILFYYLKKNKAIISTRDISEGLFEHHSLWAGIIKYDLINNSERKIVTLSTDFTYYENKNYQLHPTAEEWIIEGLKFRMGTTPCKYELNK